MENTWFVRMLPVHDIISCFETRSWSKRGDKVLLGRGASSREQANPHYLYQMCKVLFECHSSGLINLCRAPLSFYYCKHRVQLVDSDVHIYCIKKEISMPHANPIFEYYRYNTDKERQQKLRAPRAPSGLNNELVQSKYDTRYRLVTPTDWRHDPYFVCILMSLAQLQDRKGLGPLEGLFLVTTSPIPSILDRFSNLASTRHASLLRI